MPPGKFGYGRHSIDQQDIDAVVDVLKSDFLTQGPTVPKFEDGIRELTGAKYAVAFANGTAALHGAAWAAGAGPGEVGVTQAITFCATANALRYCGADVAFADIDLPSVNMSVASLIRTIEALRRTGREPKLVMPVHMGGLSVGADALRNAAGDALVVEDAAHSIGAHYDNGQPVGCGAHADISIFSFHPVKPITTAEGGVAVTNDATLASRMRRFRNHGIERDEALLQGSDSQVIAPRPWYYEQVDLGYNYRLSDIHAALGVSQLRRLAGFASRRRSLAAIYDQAFAGNPMIVPLQSRADWRSRSAHHLYIVLIDYDALGTSRGEFMQGLLQCGIGTQVHYIPVHKHPYYVANPPVLTAELPETERYYRGALSLPFFPAMTNDDAEFVVASIKSMIGERRPVKAQA